LTGTSLLRPYQINRLDGMSKMRDNDASADHKCDIERIVEFFVGPTFADRLFQVVVNTVVAAKHRRCHESQQLFGLAIERLIPVRAGIQAEETLDPKVIDLAYAVVHPGTVLPELIHARIRHNAPFRKTRLDVSPAHRNFVESSVTAAQQGDECEFAIIRNANAYVDESG
jgi:hypothetical protein